MAAVQKLSREEVGEVVALALRSGLTERDIARLPSVHKLLLGRSRTPRGGLRGSAALALLLLLLLLLLLCAPLRQPALRLWFWLRGLSVESQLCVLEFPDLHNPFRRPLDCQFCHNITAIDRKSNLSHEEFLRAYAYSMQPVVVEDGQRNWSAREVFSFEFFTQIYDNDSRALDNSGSECQFFPYDTEFLNLGDVFSMEAGRAGMHSNAKPWYIGWSNCDSSAASILRQHYKRPYFIPAISESSKMDWIFMGVPGHGAYMHVRILMT
ncbi:uncharacterized protein [Heterodontus francisci]|uniref:uncharacterized protein isoform X2 n=1 Tax=Heterodontus francisci TaxID=7792 RepID=UPI00355B2348